MSEKERLSRVSIRRHITEEYMPSFLRILAAYIAEGHLCGEEDNPTSCVISQNNIAWLSSLSADVKLLSTSSNKVGYVNNREQEKDKTSRLEIHSIVWAQVLKSLCGRYSETKRIPDFVYNLSYEYKMLFLNTLIEGDGNKASRMQTYHDVTLSEEYLEKFFSYVSVSRELVSGFSLLCKLCNINFSINTRINTKSGKPIYRISYVKSHRCENIKTAESNHFEGYLYDIEVDDPHSHNFACGIGMVVCHNTNETEFRTFMSEKKYEAYHDRMYIVRMPYNLSVTNEVNIYKKLLTNTDATQSMSIAPRTLEAASMFADLTRLEEGEDISLLKKMKLYDGQHVRGYKKEQVHDLRKKHRNEGVTGVSPRFVIDSISSAISKSKEEGKNFITALDILRSLNTGITSRDAFTDEQKTQYIEHIDDARREWNDMLRGDIQKAFFLEYEKEAQALCENYLDQIQAACADEKPRDPVTGEVAELDNKLMDLVESQIGITESGKNDFRNEILRAAVPNARQRRDGTYAEFDYTQHAQLREGIQKALFEERKGVIRMTVSSRSPDPEAIKRLNDVVNRMCEQQGYSPESANELLKYASAHLFDK